MRVINTTSVLVNKRGAGADVWSKENGTKELFVPPTVARTLSKVSTSFGLIHETLTISLCFPSINGVMQDIFYIRFSQALAV